VILTKNQKTSILNRLADLWPNRRPCPVCGNDDWAISEHMFELREPSVLKYCDNPNYSNQSLNFGLGAASFPVIPVSCTKCGYTHFFNAITLGLIDGQTGNSK
jgi:predicted nucleic-acid-binding Zn-ribbon protein